MPETKTFLDPPCSKCKKKINWLDGKGLRDVDHKWVGLYCNHCYEEALKDLQKRRYVTTYREQDIYEKDRKYSPWWDSLYYYASLEDAKTKIDNSLTTILKCKESLEKFKEND